MLNLYNNQRLCGIILVLICALDWVAFSYIVKNLETTSVSPFILTLISNSLFIICLPISSLKKYISNHKKKYEAIDKNENSSENGNDTNLLNLMKLSFIIAMLFFTALVTYNASLMMTSVMSNTILSSTSSFITFVFSMIFLKEKCTVYKIISFIFSITGSFLVIYIDSKDKESGQENLFGDILALLSCALYAGYLIVIKKYIPNSGHKNEMLDVFGYNGLFIILFTGLPTLLLSFTKYVNIDITFRVFVILIFKGLFDNVLMNFLFAKATLLIGPTIAVVGLSLQWPITILIDFLFYKPEWIDETISSILMIIGIIMILIGFLCINLSDIIDTDTEK